MLEKCSRATLWLPSSVLLLLLLVMLPKKCKRHAQLMLLNSAKKLQRMIRRQMLTQLELLHVLMRLLKHFFVLSLLQLLVWLKLLILPEQVKMKLPKQWRPLRKIMLPLWNQSVWHLPLVPQSWPDPPLSPSSPPCSSEHPPTNHRNEFKPLQALKFCLQLKYKTSWSSSLSIPFAKFKSVTLASILISSIIFK